MRRASRKEILLHSVEKNIDTLYLSLLQFHYIAFNYNYMNILQFILF